MGADHGIKFGGVGGSVVSNSPSVPFGASLSSSNTPPSANRHTNPLPDVELQLCELMLLIYMVLYTVDSWDIMKSYDVAVSHFL